MRHKDNLCCKQSRGPNVLEDVVVVADQDATFPSKKLEGSVFVARREVLRDKRVDLAMLCDAAPFWIDADVGVVNFAIVGELKLDLRGRLLCTAWRLVSVTGYWDLRGGVPRWM